MQQSFRPVDLCVLGVFVVGLIAAGCSGSREDVRVTLCKDLVAVRLGTSQPLTWTGSEAQARGHEDAVVRLRYSGSNGDGDAVCYYAYNAVDDTAQMLSDPLSAYSTSPSKMILNGKTLSRQELAVAVKDAMLKQGKSLVDGAKKMFQ